ncbi:sugar ABC transporter permease [Clostridiaceae bacterium OttesenSCG-928-D20]|nr:sugar ABC transporter permease [Clostridiaceae bacterium OttesenSCG-928-D20]
MFNSKTTGRLGRRAALRSNISGWMIMLPTLILFAFFVWEPLLESIRLSFYSTKGFNTVTFVGLKNYRNLFAHPSFWPAIRNTFVYIFYSLVLGFWVPLFMAVMITEAIRGKGFFRVGVYFPNIMPGLATIIIWSYIYSSEGTGILNIMLGWFGVDAVRWLSIPKLTIPLIVLTMTWKSAGSTALIYMAGISGINAELYEAAALDGAGIWKRVRHVIFPSIFRLSRTMLILQIISVFQILYEPLMLTNGGPNLASISIMQLVYTYAFQDFNYAMAAALSVLICFILVILTIIYFALTRKIDD